jgi:hypothetical protein
MKEQEGFGISLNTTSHDRYTDRTPRLCAQRAVNDHSAKTSVIVKLMHLAPAFQAQHCLAQRSQQTHAPVNWLSALHRPGVAQNPTPAFSAIPHALILHLLSMPVDTLAAAPCRRCVSRTSA